MNRKQYERVRSEFVGKLSEKLIEEAKTNPQIATMRYAGDILHLRGFSFSLLVAELGQGPTISLLTSALRDAQGEMSKQVKPRRKIIL